MTTRHHFGTTCIFSSDPICLIAGSGVGDCSRFGTTRANRVIEAGFFRDETGAGFRSRGIGVIISEISCDAGTGQRPLAVTALKEKLVKIGAKVVSHARYVAFQLAEVAIPRGLFADVLWMIA